MKYLLTYLVYGSLLCIIAASLLYIGWFFGRLDTKPPPDEAAKYFEVEFAGINRYTGMEHYIIHVGSQCFVSIYNRREHDIFTQDLRRCPP